MQLNIPTHSMHKKEEQSFKSRAACLWDMSNPLFIWLGVSRLLDFDSLYLMHL
jgi:hypothetical protein